MSEALRVFRAGDWHPFDAAAFSRCVRIGYDGMHQRYNLGFRCVLLKGTNSHRVYRGGGWGNDAALCRAATRDDGDPDDRDGNIGLRCVRRDG